MKELLIAAALSIAITALVFLAVLAAIGLCLAVGDIREDQTRAALEKDGFEL